MVSQLETNLTYARPNRPPALLFSETVATFALYSHCIELVGQHWLVALARLPMVRLYLWLYS